ncbi:MAG: hypothetical protein JNL28_17355 [Planctomycetes bacterium]|nr:hypothetical protein [Planctomycetota bacterium]
MALVAYGLVRSSTVPYDLACYRDGVLSYCDRGTFNYTNAVAVVWSP